jgi:hypothetical protein
MPQGLDRQYGLAGQTLQDLCEGGGAQVTGSWEARRVCHNRDRHAIVLTVDVLSLNNLSLPRPVFGTEA